MLNKKISDKLLALKEHAHAIKSDPKLRHHPNDHDISTVSENTNLMQPYQYQTLTEVEQDTYAVNFLWDKEASVWTAISEEIPLALESESLGQLVERVSLAAPELLELNGHNMPKTYTAIIHPCTDTSGYWACCDMPNGGANTLGETLQETQQNMLEAMELYMEDYPHEEYRLNFELHHI